jgi:amidohydrolase
MLEKARAIQGQLSEWRCDFHMYPELGFQEMRTAARVAEHLEAWGYRVRRGVGRTGVVADRGQGKPVVAIRADMDALPLQEVNQVAYASQNLGVMHACGHDAHTAMSLGAALLLSRERFPGTVRFLFQPAEEVGDEEGISGAPRMIEDGALEGVDAILALHVDPHTATGDICIKSGPASGGVDSWFGRVLGQGGHGAKPQETVDPFYLAAHVILALNAIPSRRLNPFDPAVVSIGSLQGGFTENVIPAHVDMTGTLRFTEARVQAQIHAEIRRAFELTRPLGGDYELRFEIGSLPIHNHPTVTELIRSTAVDMLGAAHVLPLQPELGAEDFASMSAVTPGAMFVLGTRLPDERVLHNPAFDLDEAALPIGAAIFVGCALRFLRGEITVS